MLWNWYLIYTKYKEIPQGYVDVLLETKAIKTFDFDGHEEAKEECRDFAIKLAGLYEQLYEWVIVEKIIYGYRITHPNKRGEIIVDYIAVDDWV